MSLSRATVGRGAGDGRPGLAFGVVAWVATLPCSDFPPPTEPITISRAMIASTDRPIIQPRDRRGGLIRAARRSFLRTYADYLGLDSKLLVEEYRLRHEQLGVEAEVVGVRAQERAHERGPRQQA